MKRFLGLFLALFAFSCPFPSRGENGLISKWNFEDSGPTVTDSGPAQLTGTIRGNVQRVEGLKGMALSFPGALDSHVAFDRKEPLDIQENLTLSAWVYRNNTGTRWDGILINGRHQSGYQLFYSEINQRLTFYIHTDTTPYFPVTGAHVPMSEWMHLAATYDGNEVRLYQNGQLTARQACTGKITNFPDEFRIGSAVFPFNAFRGLIDEVRVHHRALSPEEIGNLYEKSAPKNHAPAPEPVPAFQNLEAIRTPDGIRFTFEATPEFLETKQGSIDSMEVWIYRNHHRLNQENPGVRDGELVFSGSMPPQADGKYEFLDPRPVLDGHTYYYWVTPDRKNFRQFPAQVRIHHPEIWWTPETIRKKTYALAELFPDLVQIKPIGKTVERRPLEALLVGNRERMIALVGAVHVSESGPELILGGIEKLLKENPHLVQEVGIAAVPCVTLDVRQQKLATGYPRYLRKNAAGVDLNRNFPAHWEELPPPGTMQTDNPDAEIYRGPEPASEPETRALMAFITEIDPWVSFYFHSVGSLCNAGFVSTKYAPLEGDRDYVELTEKVCRIYAHAMYGDTAEDVFWLHHNSPQGGHNTWTYRFNRTPSVSMELDHRADAQVARFDAVTPELLEDYQVRHQKAFEAIIRKIIDGTILRLERHPEHPDIENPSASKSLERE